MQQACDLYFYECEYGVEDDDGFAKRPRKPTMTGLARSLGFSSLSSFYNYEGYPDQDFQWVIDTARMQVMEAYESNLHNSAASGSQFALKNMDTKAWKDRSEQHVELHNKELTQEDKKVLLAKMRASLEEKILNVKKQESIEGECEVVDPEDDDSWI